MIEASIKKDILERLKRTEQRFDVKILMAIESGSRAWGFASPNSDYDVRFIYVNKPEWYLAVDLEDKRDVIEYPIVDDIDLNGWDVRKALKLFWKSNPAFIEWIQSPITYLDDHYFRKESLQLLPDIYSIEKGIYHYGSMAKTNYREYLRKELVPHKKYFYVLRALFSIVWLEKYGEAAPIEFDKLLTTIEDNELLDTINLLLVDKKKSKEKTLAPAVPVLNQYIEKQLARLEDTIFPKADRSLEMARLNELFQDVLANNFS